MLEPESPTTGATVWLTGLSGAGKSTIARTFAKLVKAPAGRQTGAVEVEVLDGDELRTNLSADLGFTAHDRDVHGRRVGFVAELLARHGVLVLVPVIAPYESTRNAVRDHHKQRDTPFLEVFVSTPLAECSRRDPKGLYAKARSGELAGLTGVDASYEEPRQPDLRLDTTNIDPTTAAIRVRHLLRERGILAESVVD
jgi:adenylylsulfate kinase